jgi:hypothetical protein
MWRKQPDTAEDDKPLEYKVEAISLRNEVIGVIYFKIDFK